MGESIVQQSGEPNGPASEWLSGHFHFRGDIYGLDGDRVILGVVQPVARDLLDAGAIDKFFFIRYAEGGPHIRFRLRGSPAALSGIVRSTLAQYAGTSLRWVPYEPELARYGGPHAIDLAESCFFASSQIALQVIAATNNRSSRLAKGLLAMLVFMYVFLPDRRAATTFAANYGASYLHAFARQEGVDETFKVAFDAGYNRQADTLIAAVTETWTRLEDGESLLPALDEYRVGLEAIRTELAHLCASGIVATKGGPVADIDRAAHWIGPSYVHMMNNRLGINIPEEAYLAHLVVRSFEMSHLRAASDS